MNIVKTCCRCGVNINKRRKQAIYCRDCARESYKETQIKYANKPDVKEAKRKYAKERYKRADVKEHKSKYYKERYQRLKREKIEGSS